jgi:hypothetical protein
MMYRTAAYDSLPALPATAQGDVAIVGLEAHNSRTQLVLYKGKACACAAALLEQAGEQMQLRMMRGSLIPVCCAAGVIKHVQHLRVFITTTIISLWAYVWMLIVYLWLTPSEVIDTATAIGLLGMLTSLTCCCMRCTSKVQ